MSSDKETSSKSNKIANEVGIVKGGVNPEKSQILQRPAKPVSVKNGKTEFKKHI